MKNRKMNISTYIVSISASAVGIFLNFFLARILGANAYGNLQFIISIPTTISSFLVLGLTWFLIREAHINTTRKKILNSSITLLFIVSTYFLPIIYFVVKKLLNNYYANGLLIFFLICLSILISLISIFSSFYQGIGKYSISVIIDTLLPKGLLLLFSILFFILGLTNKIVDYYFILYLLIYSVVCSIFLIRHFRSFKLTFSQEEFKTIFFFFGMTITNTLSLNLLKIFQASWYNDKVALAIISVSMSVVSLVGIFTNAINNMIKPILSKHYKERNTTQVFNIFRFCTRANAYISTPFFAFFITQPIKFLSIFGESYIIYPFILVLISLKTLITSITGANGTLLSMIGKEKIEFINGVLHLFFFIILSFVFKELTTIGLCLALLIGDVLIALIKYFEVFCLYKKSPLDIKSFVSVLLVFFIDFLLIFPMNFVQNFWIWFPLSICVGVSCIIVNFLIPIYKKELKTLFLIGMD